MSQDRGSDNRVTKLFHLKKRITLVELVVLLQCSPRTAQRRLAEHKAIHSYNHNARYYTLPEIPTFDTHGLWRHRGVFFSKYGSLPETFVHVVGNSPAGLTAGEVGSLLGVRPSSFLWALRNHPSLKREKHQGHYVYMAFESDIYTRQREQRLQMIKTNRQPTPTEAIAILVEKIKNPALTDEALCRRLRNQQLQVEPEMVGNLFAQHGLAVKKTPHSV